MREKPARQGGGGMAMRSLVSWALVGLVIHRPSYGYELVRRFERIYGDSLELSSRSQIYTALDSLQRRGWVEEMSPPDPSEVVRQPKPHYRATAAGRAAYRQWLIGQVHDERRRSRLFARQLTMLAPTDTAAVLDALEHACLAEASEGSVDGSPASLAQPDGTADLLTRLELEDDRLALSARLAWVHYARLQLGHAGDSSLT